MMTETGREQLEQTIAALEAQRATLGDEVVETALAPLREKLAALERMAEPAEKQKLVTVLFADVSGFTALSETLDAEDLQDLLRRLWSRLDQTILRHGGYIDKHLGDAVMAVWGLAQSREDDPIQAVRAGLALQAELVPFCKEQNVALGMRVGVSTGLVSVFYVESTGERNLIGDTINLAARLEHVAPVNGVLVSQSTYDETGSLFDVQAQPPLTVKGKAAPLQTYLVLSEKPRAFYMPTRGPAGITTRTVGRDTELAVLQTAYRQALAGEGRQWVTVSGKAGVGKSRLLAEFYRWIESREEQVSCLKGQAWPQTESTPYYLLRDLLSFHFQIRGADPLPVARDKLTAGLSEVLGDELGEEAAAFIGQLVGFDFRYSQWIAHIADDTRQIRGRAGVLLREYLAQLCTREPVVLLLEDLHWADLESLTLLSDILAELQSGQLCVIGLVQPAFWEQPMRWGQNVAGESLARYRLLDLSPLSDEQAGELVLELLQKVAHPPDWLIALLVEHGGGNPYFTEELVHWLIGHGVIEISPDVWQVAEERPVELSIPGTVREVLQARIERLSQEERATLQWAAVVGRVFWNGAVAYIGQEAVPPERWKRLQWYDLVCRQPMSRLQGEMEYHFKSTLLRDVVYEHTLKKLRREFHERAAEWLIWIAAERADEWAAMIAAHYKETGDREATVEWYARAGIKAQATYAPEAAISYYKSALVFLPEDVHGAIWRVGLNEGLGEVLRRQAQYTEALEAFEAMRSAAETTGDAVAQARAWNGLSDVQDSQGKHRAALESADQAEEITRAAGAPAQAELTKALMNKGWALMMLGDTQEALTLGNQALAFSAVLAPPARKEMALSLDLLGAVHNKLGDYEQSAHCKERALALSRELGDRRRVALMLNNLGETAHLRGDYRSAAALYQDALASAREIGERDGEMLYLSNLGGARVGLGEHPAAEADLREAIRMAETAEFIALSETYRFLAEALLGQGQVTDALAAAEQALVLEQETEQQEFIGGVWRALGMVAAQVADPIAIGDETYDAAACFAESVRSFTEMGAEGERAHTLRAWARYEVEKGDQAQGEAMWQEARDLFVRLGMELEVERMGTHTRDE